MTPSSNKERNSESVMQEVVEYLIDAKELADDIDIISIMETETIVKEYIEQNRIRPSYFGVEAELNGFSPVVPFSLISRFEDDKEKGFLAVPIFVVEYIFNKERQRIKITNLWFVFDSVDFAYEISKYLHEIMDGDSLIDNYPH